MTDRKGSSSGEAMHEALGFKKLARENWRSLDPISAMTVIVGRQSVRPMTADEVAELILRRDLSPKVPHRIRQLFEVARGSLCYGAFFYPLYALGAEQLYRVLEAALRTKCEEAGAPASVLKSFRNANEWGAKQGLIAEEHVNQWRVMAHLRNEASHPTQQTIHNQAMSLDILDITVDLLDALFDMFPNGDQQSGV